MLLLLLLELLLLNHGQLGLIVFLLLFLDLIVGLDPLVLQVLYHLIAVLADILLGLLLAGDVLDVFLGLVQVLWLHELVMGCLGSSSGGSRCCCLSCHLLGLLSLSLLDLPLALGLFQLLSPSFFLLLLSLSLGFLDLLLLK